MNSKLGFWERGNESMLSLERVGRLVGFVGLDKGLSSRWLLDECQLFNSLNTIEEL
jgi:hypothetical protein